MTTAQQPEALKHAEWLERSLAIGATEAASELRRLNARVVELEEDMQFVERWAVHHGSKTTCTAKEALSCIQHYPSIQAITDSYADGKRPETFDPYARISELEAQLEAIGQGGVESLRGAKPLSDEEIAKATRCDMDDPIFMIAKGFVQAGERAHGIK